MQEPGKRRPEAREPHGRNEMSHWQPSCATPEEPLGSLRHREGAGARVRRVGVMGNEKRSKSPFSFGKRGQVAADILLILHIAFAVAFWSAAIGKQVEHEQTTEPRSSNGRGARIARAGKKFVTTPRCRRARMCQEQMQMEMRENWRKQRWKNGKSSLSCSRQAEAGQDGCSWSNQWQSLKIHGEPMPRTC